MNGRETKEDLVMVGWMKRWSINGSKLNRGKNLKKTLKVFCIIIHININDADAYLLTWNQHKNLVSVGNWNSLIVLLWSRLIFLLKLCIRLKDRSTGPIGAGAKLRMNWPNTEIVGIWSIWTWDLIKAILLAWKRWRMEIITGWGISSNSLSALCWRHCMWVSKDRKSNLFSFPWWVFASTPWSRILVVRNFKSWLMGISTMEEEAQERRKEVSC